MSGSKGLMSWFSKKPNNPKNLKDILSIPANIPFFYEFAINAEIDKLLGMWISIETIRNLSVDIIDGEKLIAVKDAVLNITQKHFTEGWLSAHDIDCDKSKVEKLSALVKIIEGNRGSADGEEPILEAIFEIFLEIQKAVLSKLDSFSGSFLDSVHYKEMIDKNYDNPMTPISPSKSAGTNTDSNPKLDDSESQSLKIRKNHHRIFHWSGDNTISLLQLKPCTETPPLSNELCDILSVSYGIQRFHNYLEKNGDSLWNGDGKHLLSFWILIESYQEWNLAEKLNLREDENVQRIEAAKIFDTFFSRQAPQYIKQMPVDIIKDMERYVSNRLGDDGQPVFFECFIRAQKEVLEKMVKRFHKSFLESKDYELYQQDRLVAIRETIKMAQTSGGTTSTTNPTLSTSETEEPASTVLATKKRDSITTRIGDSNLTIGYMDELGFFSTGMDESDLDFALSLDPSLDKKSKLNEENFARGLAKLHLSDKEK